MLDVYERLPVCHNIEDAKPRTKDVILDEEIQFSSLLLEEPIQKGLAKCGYRFLSPIQRNALPLALTGNSIIVHAKSGTGKTLVFLLTALNSYLKSKSDGLFTLILAPTREIAKQVYDVCKNVSSFIEGLNVEYFIGGVPLDIDVLKCQTCHIAIGAPGRIKHLIDLGELRVQKLRLLVLDEVDVLINNKEFAINEVVSQLPVARQDLVCTATYTEDIGVRLESIAANLQYINTSEEESSGNISSMSNMLLGIKQYVLPVSSDFSVMDSLRKRNKLIDVLKNFNYDQCFVFVNYLSLVKSVHNFLLKHDLSAEWLSSEQTQSMRVANLNKLKLNECKILVTTDLAARGIDVHNVNLVVNLSLPTPPDVYVHRMGRAGRYGSEGSVITIVHEGVELQTFKELVSFVITEPADLYVMPSEINAETMNSTLTAITCDPKPDSVVIREIIAKHVAKTENLPKKIQPKKRKQRKTKPRNRPSERRMRPGAAYESDREITVPKMRPPRPRNANERLSGFADRFHQELNRLSKVEIESDVIQQLAMPKESTRSRLHFTNYHEIPDMPEKCDVIETDTPVHESLLRLAAVSRAENSFVDSQRIPLNPHEFFTSVDYKKEMNLQNNSIQARKLKTDILNIVHELLDFPTPIDGLSSDSADDGAALRISTCSLLQSDSCRTTSTTTSESSEPPVKMRTTRYKTSTIIPPALRSDNISDSASRVRNSLPFLRPTAPTHDLLGRKYSSINGPCCMPPPQHASMPMLRPIPPKDFAQLRSRGAAKPSLCDRAKAVDCVQCPQCDHRFSVRLPFYSANSLPTNKLTSLAPYVDIETERMIYANHFNFITSHIASVQSFDPNN